MTAKTRCFAHNHMTIEEFGAYEYIISVSHASGVFYMDGRGLAEQFAGTGKNSAYRVVEQLESKGWIVRLAAGGRSKNGTFQPTQYRPVTHDEWTKAHPNLCVTSPRNGTGTSPENGTGTSPENGNHQSQFRESPVPETGHNLVKKREVKRERENTNAKPAPSISDNSKSRTVTVADLMAIAHRLDSRLVFSKTAKQVDLPKALAEAGDVTFAESEWLVRKALDGCTDPTSYTLIGSTLATNMTTWLKPHREVLRREEEKRASEDHENRRKAAREPIVRLLQPHFKSWIFDGRNVWRHGKVWVCVNHDGKGVSVIAEDKETQQFAPSDIDAILRAANEAAAPAA